ncbi:MAG: glycosyl hydrolase family 38, partial [Candidatus Omnitrophica bacterium]|nr:glycosyl hydrolase family 38 [Candidatus Omnitrophota bacterium]
VVIVGTNDQPIPGLTEAIQTDEVVAGRIRSATFSSTPIVLKTPQGPRQMLVGLISSGGVKDVNCRLSLEEGETLNLPIGDLPLGEHRVELLVPTLAGDRSANLVLEYGSDRFEVADIPLKKPREWTLYLVQHTHTDIGYTRPQNEILPDFIRQIDYALDYCDLTDNYPEDSKFRWTCETSWVVREYLKRRPQEQIDRLKRRVQEGRVEITGMFLNFDELADENTLAASLQPIQEFHENGFPVVTAMQNDVPGAPWAVVDYFSDIGVKYLSMGINNDRTPRPFDRPTAFWWESPSGKRILAWRPDHYHTGNHLRLHQDRIEPIQEKTLEYLLSLEETGYPFNRIAIQYSGTQMDNSPPAMKECDLIREWNETHVWPKMRSATAHEFFEYVERNHAEYLPVYRGAWPNWWTDGYAFAHVETAAARKSHVELSVAEGLLTIASLLGEKIPSSAFPEIRDIEDDLLFYDEHTFGAQEEFTHPTAENSIVQYQMKVSHVWEAVKNCQLLKETAWGFLNPHLPKGDAPTIAVFNTLPWERSGRVDVYIGHEILPLDRQYRILDMETGKEIPARLERSRFEGSYWNLWVSNVPAMGFKTFRIEVEDKPAAPQKEEHSDSLVLENPYYRIVADASSGTIASLYDKELDRELVEEEAPYGFGQFIYDRLADAHFFNRESFLARSTRSTLRDVKVVGQGETPLWESLLITGNADGCLNEEGQPSLECEVRLYRAEKKVEFQYHIRKKYISEPESVYVAFPFAFPDGKFFYE